MLIELNKIDKQKVGFFRFKQLNDKYLITNDIGDYSFLTSQEFDSFLSGKIEQISPEKYSELQNRGFIRDKLDLNMMSERYAIKHRFLGGGPPLHIVVITLRCDHKCIYCQSQPGNIYAQELDMDIPTAKEVVNRIFECPNSRITIEFQGGEPLLNFKTIKFIVEYAQEKNKSLKKNLGIHMVSNLSLMNEKILKFLIENNIGICTSLDGPSELHNRNRVIFNKDSYKNTVRWLKKIAKKYRERNPSFKPSALVTLTRSSLAYPREIIKEYLNLNLGMIHLRPMNPFTPFLGKRKEIWRKIGYSPEEFIHFYKEAVDYIIDLNLKGENFWERTARIFLTKILTPEDPNFLDIRSPCGAVIGQIAYNFDGNVYACDEARMVARAGDKSFCLGNVKEDTYKDFIDNPITKALCIASCLDNLSECNQCVYKAYCGVCPVSNYVINKDIFVKNVFLCRMYSGILDYLFKKLQDEKFRDIFLRWVERKEGV